MDNFVKTEGNSIYFKNQRITFLTDSLVRLEYSEKNRFVDDKTQMVINRDFDNVNYSYNLSGDYLEIKTKTLFIETSGKEFSALSLKITLRQSEDLYFNTYRYGDKLDNLKGTARTLDEADGEIPLEDGLLSKRGFSLIDDSNSMLLINNYYKQREKGNKDIYFFGYNHNYLTCLKDFYKLTGKSPMIPRYALGNWWSRYYQYTTQSYLELLDRFKEEDIPFSVAVIDMDWHLVDIDRIYGSGWTGYTWNKELFPNPKDFLDELHKRLLKVTLNDHPADGVRPYENNYDQMAEKMGVEDGESVLFDASNKKYLDSLQTIILEPLENDGVDFWWIDWQQGNTSRIEGLDPLWTLNYHRFLSNRKNNNRPLIFSRYAGVGSHRYPVGFSGDTYITWKSLAFQPKFTVCASNIGYGWWSHDIGGHMGGYKDNDLMARWTQFGVFSPIMRLHSSKEIFNGKEPWRYNDITHKVMSTFLKLRHQLIPYLYTMNYQSWKNDIPLIRPMYYYHSEEEQAYEIETQYYFGSSMIVSPIVTKQNKKLQLGSALTWLPDGIYYDFFSSRKYLGNRTIKMFRTLETMPVLIKAGSIISLTNDFNAQNNPKSLNLKCYMGSNGEFELYEDDNISEDYKNNKNVITRFENNFENCEFVIHKSIGNLSLIPEKRNYKLEFIGISDTDLVIISNDKKIDFVKKYDNQNKLLTLIINDIKTDSDIIIKFETLNLVDKDKIEDYKLILDRSEISISLKDKIFHILEKNKNDIIISDLISLNLNNDLYNALMEVLLSS
ncbi:MAG: TIM-barrel domain-containing protein [Pleomorphochaeta sp.]